jgi:hypothetical protein
VNKIKARVREKDDEQKNVFFLISINLYNRLPGKSSKELDDVVNYNWSVSKESVKECDYSTTQPRDFLYHDKKRKRRRLKYAAEKHTQVTELSKKNSPKSDSPTQ